MYDEKKNFNYFTLVMFVMFLWGPGRCLITKLMGNVFKRAMKKGNFTLAISIESCMFLWGPNV